MKKPIPGSLLHFSVVNAVYTPEGYLLIVMKHPDITHELSFLVEQDKSIERLEIEWQYRQYRPAMAVVSRPV